MIETTYSSLQFHLSIYICGLPVRHAAPAGIVCLRYCSEPPQQPQGIESDICDRRWPDSPPHKSSTQLRRNTEAMYSVNVTKHNVSLPILGYKDGRQHSLMLFDSNEDEQYKGLSKLPSGANFISIGPQENVSLTGDMPPP